MSRRVLNLLKRLSLSLAAAAVAVGLLSYAGEAALTSAWPASRWTVSLSRGELLVEWGTPLPGGSFHPGLRLSAGPATDFTEVVSRQVYGSGGGTHVSFLGGVEFARAHLPKGGRGAVDASYAIIPLWLLLVPAAVAWTPAAWRAVRGRTRGRAGRCRRCGYDLRATPDRCPECGAIPYQSPSLSIVLARTHPLPVDYFRSALCGCLRALRTFAVLLPASRTSPSPLPSPPSTGERG